MLIVPPHNDTHGDELADSLSLSEQLISMWIHVNIRYFEIPQHHTWLSTSFNKKWRFHVNYRDLEIPTLKKEKEKITHHWHYNFVVKKYPFIFWLQLSVNVCKVSKIVFDYNPPTPIFFGLLYESIPLESVFLLAATKISTSGFWSWSILGGMNFFLDQDSYCD
jgi:hypothetical protein